MTSTANHTALLPNAGPSADAITIRAPKESERARIDSWEPIPLSELGESEPVDWLWHGYLAPGCSTLLTGLWKAGKTTLLAHIYRAMDRGGHVAGEIRSCQVIVVTEESATLWLRRRDDLSIADHVRLFIRPFRARPSRREWAAFIGRLSAIARRDGVDLVVFDTLSSVWPVDDENNAAVVQAALTPLQGVLEAGAAVLLVHHPKKGDSGQGQAARGSGALTGFVDVILELRRAEPEDRENTRRTLISYSRFDETPSELVIDYNDGTYQVIGTQAEARQEDRMKVLDDILAAVDLGFHLSVDQLRERWPTSGPPKPAKRTLFGDLDAGYWATPRRWERVGTAKRGDPYRWFRCAHAPSPKEAQFDEISIEPSAADDFHPQRESESRRE